MAEKGPGSTGRTAKKRLARAKIKSTDNGIKSSKGRDAQQAAAAAAIEAVCDEENDRLREEIEAEGLYLRPRFSPGYGDLSLE